VHNGSSLECVPVTRYREICTALALRAGSGELRPGDELPGVRELAREWGTTASTVSRAQRHLADAGVLELSHRRRARVAADAVAAALRFLHDGPVLTLAGSDDPALDLVVRTLAGRVRVVTGDGSSAGLRAVRQGRADGATVHLPHHSGVPNAPFARGLLRGLEPHLIHLWRREQGLIVAPGNPAGVTLAGLSRHRLAVRRPGTGTRVLLDRLLLDSGQDPDALRGPEFGTHVEVALAVATGTVDAGLGVRYAAADLDLDFLPVTWEDYDVALPAGALGAAAPLVAALCGDPLRAAVTALGGYDTARSGTVTPVAG